MSNCWYFNYRYYGDIIPSGIQVVVTGVTLVENPPASVFEHAIGPIGKNIFGIVLFAAAMSSVIGSAYTSATFLKTLHKSLNERSNLIVIEFIVISTMIFLFIGKPISLLIIAGAINGCGFTYYVRCNFDCK